ncbi:hypothetical protein JHK82_018826 [Glycine max]|nr:hypothetical protein JHK85_019273 [Glycine max]KAG5038009.1 hypothetical protein JHK86_018849 [Glycine max]KAG5143131.1 hypothetical protein JHK82_018826 [Glycine max]
MYIVDEAKGVLRRYVEEQDAWEEILENHRLKGVEQIFAQRGKLCVILPSSGISVVDVAAKFHGVLENPTETIANNLTEYMNKKGLPKRLVIGSSSILETAG